MCGIAGIISPADSMQVSQNHTKRAVIEQGLLLASLRGVEGSGLALIEPKKSPVVYKRALRASDFLQLEQTQNVLTNIDRYQVVLAHARSATKGDTSDTNAHPFQYGHITLIHNGTVYNSHIWKREAESEVDSAQIAYAISKEGAKDVLEYINGDYVVVWHDARENTINVAKNAGRTLYWGQIPEWKDSYVFMSELGALSYVLQRNGLKVKDTFRYPATNHIYSLRLGAKEAGFQLIPFAHRPTQGRGTHTLQWAKAITSRGASPSSPTDKEIMDEVAKRPNTEPKVDWRPSKRKGIKKVDSRLRAEVDLYFDTPYAVRAKVFVPYDGHKDYGLIIVCMTGPGKQDQQGEVHHMDLADYEILKNVDFFHALPVNLRYHGSRKMVVFEPDPNQNSLDLDPKKTGVLEGMVEDAFDEGHNVSHIYKGPGGKMMPLDQWLDATQDGCCNCNCFMTPTQSDDILWVGDNNAQALCPRCAESPQVIRALGIYDENGEV